ncbi:MAG: hypothetical protein J6X60_11570, partial [Ruminiclostridium sp.]|nr:hypothetical protein [Ruminiclostridium sp.]
MTPKFYKCRQCGQIAAIVDKKACPIKCCGEAMEEITANTVDAAKASIRTNTMKKTDLL